MAAILPSPGCLTLLAALFGQGLHSFQRQEGSALNTLQKGASGALSATGGTRWADLCCTKGCEEGKITKSRQECPGWNQRCVRQFNKMCQVMCLAGVIHCGLSLCTYSYC